MKTEDLQALCKQVRRDIISSITAAKSGHPGGSLSAVEILVALYFEKMNIDPKQPDMPGRDRFVLSKGHAAPCLYAVLAERGYFDPAELQNLRKLHSFLQGHPDSKKCPGVEASTGSLGQGISAAVGMAIAGKLDKKDYRVYAMLGDGEVEEGQVWEAAMSAAKYHLDNLCAVVDVNGLQIDGRTADVMPSEPLDEKFRAFGWHVLKADGHDLADLDRAFREAAGLKDAPTVILARTVKGKGVSFMENDAGWHGKAPNDEQFEKAIAELRGALAELEGK